MILVCAALLSPGPGVMGAGDSVAPPRACGQTESCRSWFWLLAVMQMASYPQGHRGWSPWMVIMDGHREQRGLEGLEGTWDAGASVPAPGPWCKQSAQGSGASRQAGAGRIL